MEVSLILVEIYLELFSIAFEEKQITVSKIDDQSVEMNYLTKSTSLSRITDEKLFAERQKEILNAYMREISELKVSHICFDF